MAETEIRTRTVARREWILLACILLLGLGIRLIWIRQPFVDAFSWREADDAMIARNYFLHGFHFTMPQVDWVGNHPGYVGTEFPLVNYTVALLYLVFGIHDWVGRAVSVGWWALSVPFLFLLVRRRGTSRAALAATAIYALTPLGIVCSRSFMPDTAALTASLIALWAFLEWLDHPEAGWAFLTALAAAALAILIKPPSVLIAVPMLVEAWRRCGARAVTMRSMWLLALGAVIPSVLWYWHAHRLADGYFPHHFFGEGGITLLDPSWYLGILRDNALYELGPLVFAAMLAGLVIRGEAGRVFRWWLAAIALFVLLAGWGNRHNWYRLPEVPVAAALGGITFDRLAALRTRRGWVAFVGGVTAVFLLGAAASAWYILPGFYVFWGNGPIQAAREVRQVVPPGTLIAAVDGGDPMTLYYCDRPGWHFPCLPGGHWDDEFDDDAVAIRNLEELRKDGVEYLVVTVDGPDFLMKYPDLSRYINEHYAKRIDRPECTLFDLHRSP